MDWACSKCTFVNPPTQKSNCLICLSPSEPQKPPLFSSSASSSKPQWSCKACTFLNPHQNSDCEICGTKASTSSIALEINKDDDLDSSAGNVSVPLRDCKRKIGENSIHVNDDEDADLNGTTSVTKATKVTNVMPQKVSTARRLTFSGLQQEAVRTGSAFDSSPSPALASSPSPALASSSSARNDSIPLRNCKRKIRESSIHVTDDDDADLNGTTSVTKATKVTNVMPQKVSTARRLTVAGLQQEAVRTGSAFDSSSSPALASSPSPALASSSSPALASSSSARNVSMPLRHCKRKIRESSIHVTADDDADLNGTTSVTKATKVTNTMPPKVSTTRQLTIAASLQQKASPALASLSSPAVPASQDAAALPLRPEVSPQQVQPKLGLAVPTTHTWIRSVRQPSLRPVLELGTSSTATSAPVRPRTRGPITSSRSKKITKKFGRTVVRWEAEIGSPEEPYVDRLTKDIGAWVRDACPMLYACYSQVPDSEFDRLMTFLSLYYKIDSVDTTITKWIKRKASDVYVDWKWRCKKEYLRNGREPPIPCEFEHRANEWEWLMAHFDSPEFQRKSAAMKSIRASDNKKDHTSGPKRFTVRAKGYRTKGVLAPFLKVYSEMHDKTAPERAAAVKKARDNLVAAAVNPIAHDADQPTDASSAPPPPVTIDLEAEVNVLVSTVGPARGTRVPGIGSLPDRAMKRGPKCGASSSSTARGSQSSEEISQLRETVDDLTGRLSAKEAHELELEQEVVRLREARERDQAEMETFRERMAAFERFMAASTGS